MVGIGPLELTLILVHVVTLGAAWVLCKKVGRSRLLVLAVVVPAGALLLALYLTWEALPRVGYSRWLTLLILIPIVSLLVLLWLAYGRWPEELEPPTEVARP